MSATDDLDEINGLKLAVRRFFIERNALRATLAPLLDDYQSTVAEVHDECIFCHVYGIGRHERECPVMRADELLGRVLTGMKP